MRTCDLSAARMNPQTLARHGECCEGADRIVLLFNFEELGDGLAHESEFRLVFSDTVAVGAVLVEEAGREHEFWLEDPVN